MPLEPLTTSVSSTEKEMIFIDGSEATDKKPKQIPSPVEEKIVSSDREETRRPKKSKVEISERTDIDSIGSVTDYIDKFLSRKSPLGNNRVSIEESSLQKIEIIRALAGKKQINNSHFISNIIKEHLDRFAEVHVEIFSKLPTKK